MIPQVSDVFQLARAHLGDTRTGGGQLFNDAFLKNYWPNAWSSLYRWLDRNNSKRLRRTQYYNLPANTGSITPADMGIANMGRPEMLFDRTIANTFTAAIAAINASTPGVPSSVDLTVAAHGLQTGQQVFTFNFDNTQITDDINADWYISVLDASTIRLMGCAAMDKGSAIGSTGILSVGSEAFPRSPTRQLYDIEDLPLNSQGQNITAWKWDSGALRFTPSTTDRQLKIVYMLSGNPPQDGSVGLDDSADALSLYLAGAAASAKGFAQKSSSLFMRAVGNAYGDTTNIEGGAFYELAQLGAQELNRTRIVIPRYRPRRNVGPTRYVR